MPKVQQIQPAQPKKRRVWPWVIPGIVVLIIVIVGGDWGIRKYNRYQVDVNICKRKCAYDIDTKAWQFRSGIGDWNISIYGNKFIGRSFPTQKQCIDYCLSR